MEAGSALNKKGSGHRGVLYESYCRLVKAANDPAETRRDETRSGCPNAGLATQISRLGCFLNPDDGESSGWCLCLCLCAGGARVRPAAASMLPRRSQPAVLCRHRVLQAQLSTWMMGPRVRVSWMGHGPALPSSAARVRFVCPIGGPKM